eukprot:3944321-Pleurochrysis_carterae.AAC.1
MECRSRQQPDGVQHLRHGARDGGLPGAWIAHEDVRLQVLKRVAPVTLALLDHRAQLLELAFDALYLVQSRKRSEG